MELNDLRNRIDQIDEQLQNLLTEREKMVEEIAVNKTKKAMPIFQPSRQIKILRKLLARHQGRFPKDVLLRLWLEIMGAFIRMQGDFKVAVYMPERGSGYIEIARDTFGAYTPIVDCGLVGEVIENVKLNRADVGIIPVAQKLNDAPWWLGLASSHKDNDLRVVAKLPIAGVGEGRGNGKEAYAIAKSISEETGKDNSLLVLETLDSISISALKSIFEAEGIKVKNIIDKYDLSDEARAFLIEVTGYVDNQDSRLQKIIAQKPKQISILTVIGTYGIPFSAKDLK